MRTISQRFGIAQSLLERFNPRAGHGNRKSVIYVPLQGLTAQETVKTSKPPRIVKLQRDPFLRPIKIGNWSAAETQNFQNLDEWFVPNEAQRLSMPVEGYVSSGFSWRWNRFHKGLDLAALAGTPINAAQDGIVTFSGWKHGFGLLVIIQHEEGQTYYAHCKSTRVKLGQKVARGDFIARVGNTGHSYSAHLHFELRDNHGEPMDPTPFLVPSCSKSLVLSAQPSQDLASNSLAAKATRCD